MHVIPFNRLIAWTERSTKPLPVALKTANTDGSDVKILVNTSEDGYSGSFALAYDYLQNRLYWSAPSRLVKCVYLYPKKSRFLQTLSL